jgi:gas vesicle protein GvpK
VKKKAAKRPRRAGIQPRAVTAAELRALRRELDQRLRGSGATGGRKKRNGRRRSPPMRWNPDPEDVQKSVAQLVLTIVEFLRQLMERQAIRRMERQTLTKHEVEAVGLALMRLEQTVREMAKRFGLTAEDLNLDLGPIKLV